MENIIPVEDVLKRSGYPSNPQKYRGEDWDDLVKTKKPTLCQPVVLCSCPYGKSPEDQIFFVRNLRKTCVFLALRLPRFEISLSGAFRNLNILLSRI